MTLAKRRVMVPPSPSQSSIQTTHLAIARPRVLARVRDLRHDLIHDLNLVQGHPLARTLVHTADLVPDLVLIRGQTRARAHDLTLGLDQDLVLDLAQDHALARGQTLARGQDRRPARPRDQALTAPTREVLRDLDELIGRVCEIQTKPNKCIYFCQLRRVWR